MNSLHNKYRPMIDKYVHKYCMEIFDLYMTEKELRNEFNIVSTAVSALKTDIRQAEETIITQGTHRHSPIYSLTYFIYSLTYLLTHLFTHSPIYSLT